ncbi:glutathione S-transferase [Pluteus cervinus]|uniref:Glutathione S-transferase n=1 Tax=Pluteus cervinus TaxID=181527 RepID=A0ACD3ACK5_9AGAR|nr:glutathione S-transferase [Pluteus cervinus]
MPETLTLYTAKICPYAQRVEIALAESKLPFTRYEIDLGNKPEWFAPKVNAASKVPAVAYGGPSVPPENPSPESQKIAESLVLLEFIADISGGALLPKDPVLRARVRLFIDVVSNKLVPAFTGFAFRGEPVDNFWTAIEAIQPLILGKYAVGDEFTIADAALIPFVARGKVALKYDIGKFEVGAGLKAYDVLQTDPRFEKFRRYIADVEARDSFKSTFDEQFLKERYTVRFARN